MTISGILFDFDGTLANTTTPHPSLFPSNLFSFLWKGPA